MWSHDLLLFAHKSLVFLVLYLFFFITLCVKRNDKINFDCRFQTKFTGIQGLLHFILRQCNLLTSN